MSDRKDGSVKLFSHEDDTPREGKGKLIPGEIGNYKNLKFTPASLQSSPSSTTARVGLSVLGFCLLVVLGTSGYGLVASGSQSASPLVNLHNPETNTTTTLSYGEEEALANRSLFTETRDALINEEETFLEADVTRGQLKYFVDGVLFKTAEIVSVGDSKSIWQAPSGLYEVNKKSAVSFNSTAQVELPWQITFQGNYLIHGTPRYPDGVIPVKDLDLGIQVKDEPLAEIFELVDDGVPVLVHSIKKTQSDGFVYQPSAPDINASHYYVADMDNGTILASSGVGESVPIASITKLMTAIVATENIDLETRVRATSESFVTSLIPRLSDRASASMYSLLQLLLVESSNEAAETIAAQLEREVFIEAMNDKARQLGMLNTNFADPSGLSSENLSSVDDLYKLSKYIYENKKFIFDLTVNSGISNAYVGDEFADMVNFNQIEDIENFVGGKVGETNDAGQTSVSLHEVEIQGKDRTIVVVVLGTDSRTDDIKKLLSHTAGRFR